MGADCARHAGGAVLDPQTRDQDDRHALLGAITAMASCGPPWLFIEKLPGVTEQDYARLVMENVAHGGHHGGDQDQTKHDAHSHH
jgi:hypothetical protein